MNEYLQAADDANRLLRGFAGVQKIADAFGKVGQLQQAGDEAEARLKSLAANVETSRGMLSVAEQSLKEARASARDVLQSADKHAANAQREAVEAVAQTRQECDRLVKAARVDANAVLTEARAEVAKINERQRALSNEVAELVKKRDEHAAFIAKLKG